jgi:hypothetical protein
LDRELEPSLAVLMTEEGHFRWERLAVFELDAGAPCIEVLLGHEAARLDNVRLGDRAPGMKKGFGKIAVIGRQQHATRGVVEAAHRVDSPRRVFQVIAHAETPFGIRHRRHDAPRLVKDQVDEILGDNSFAVDLNPVSPGISSYAKLGSQLAVDPHSPGGDELFGVAARGDPSPSEHLLEANVRGLGGTFRRRRAGGRIPGRLGFSFR